MKYVLTISSAALILGLGTLFFQGSASGQVTPEVATFEYSEPDNAAVQHPTELVELFTSQGCSSCPPADKFIASLADSPTTLALSFNVTYWDYLGWKDRFGQREFTKRQKSYAKSLGASNVYTPQIIVNGAVHSNQFTRRQIMSAALPDNRPMFDLKLAGSVLTVESTTGDDLSDCDLTIITYKPGLQSTPVSRGENRRRTLENYNVVRGVYELNAQTRYSLDKSGHEEDLAYVLLASDPETAEVLSLTQMLPN